jgi:hypothetical protein
VKIFIALGIFVITVEIIWGTCWLLWGKKPTSKAHPEITIPSTEIP